MRGCISPSLHLCVEVAGAKVECESPLLPLLQDKTVHRNVMSQPVNEIIDESDK
jgi:hypothetical protein